MVLPEGTRESEGSRPKALIAVGAALVLLGATVALGLATAPDAVTAQESTTTTTDDESLQEPTTTTSIDIETFSISDIATGERLSWREAPPFGSGRPIELLEHRDRMLLFTSGPGASFRGTPPGMDVWISDNGIQWDRIGGLAGPEYAVTGVASVGTDLIALGYRIEDGSPHVWISPDGAEWSGSKLSPVVLDDPSPTITTLTDAAQLGDQLIIAGTAYSDPLQAILDKLSPEIADVAERYGIGLSDGPDGRVLELFGPFGIVGFTATLEELGIDEETANRYFHGSSTDRSFVWTSPDGNDWRVVELGELYFQGMWKATDGTLVASGWNNSGPKVWSSKDGLSWELLDRSSVVVADEWNGTLVGTRQGWDLVMSHNGREWDSLGTAEVLPFLLDWNLHPIETGEAGIAAVATAWVGQTSRSPSPTTIEVDGYTLTVNHNSGRMIVRDGTSEVLRVPLWTHSSQDAVTVDFETERLIFHDPVTGEQLLNVDFATLMQAEMAAYGHEHGERALLLDDGGPGWKILDLSEELDDREWIAMMRIIGDRLLLVTYAGDSWVTGEAPAISVRVTTLN